VGLGDFIVERTALKSASSKMVKYDKVCTDNQHVFILFVFNIFGFLAPKVVNLLKKVQNVLHSNVVSSRSMNVVFQRFDFAIQKGVVALLIVYLTFIHVCVVYTYEYT
jgi:hypothetical protein